MVENKKILIVEDDPNISKLVEYNLQKAGFRTTISSTGELALVEMQKSKFHMVILDIMLPGLDGLEVCKRIRSNDLPPENAATSNVIVFNQKEAGDEEKKVWY